MTIRTLISPVSLALRSIPALCADKEVLRPKGHWPQWRGPDRLNLSPDKGLLTKWPKDGPPLAWQVNGIGQGVGPVAVAAGKVYILGHRDKDEHLTAIDEAVSHARRSLERKLQLIRETWERELTT